MSQWSMHETTYRNGTCMRHKNKYKQVSTHCALLCFINIFEESFPFTLIHNLTIWIIKESCMTKERIIFIHQRYCNVWFFTKWKKRLWKIRWKIQRDKTSIPSYPKHCKNLICFHWMLCWMLIFCVDILNIQKSNV